MSTGQVKDYFKRQISVSNSASMAWMKRLIVVLCVMGALIVSFLFYTQRSTSHIEKKQQWDADMLDYQAALNNNLKALNSFKKTLTAVKQSPALRVDKTPDGRALLARVHASTRVYAAHAAAHSAGQGPAGKSARASGLIESSPYATFANQQTQVDLRSAVRLSHPDQTVVQGELIDAVLETGIDSDLPGMIRGVVSRPVWSYHGHHVLIPAGTRLIGQYSSATLKGISRVMVLWQRAVLPNGFSVQLESPGADAMGRSGISADEVNTHFWMRFSQAALLSVIGASVSPDNIGQLYQAALMHSFQSAASQSLQETASIKPTLRVNAGQVIQVFVAKDLFFPHSAESA